MNYGELHRHAEQLSNALYAEGLRPGDRIAFLGDPDPQLVVALYASVGIGAIPLAVSPLLVVPEIAAIVEDAEPHDPIRLRSVGRPADLAAQGEQAFQVRIIAEDGLEADVNESGEIVVRGAQTMLGYWRQPKETNEAMFDGWIRTGDVGCLDADGYLYVLDRLKDMVIVGGSNVYSSEVEQVIASHEMVNDAVVIRLPLSGEGEALVACVVLQDRGSLDLAQLQAFCELSLARHKWPTHLFILDQFPRTAIDKVDKKRLRKQLSSSIYEGLSSFGER
ncbi:hypothetical protein PAT3040_01764 [Paenibacillus agaridevorans]|uniref:AMP-dependent synthetase n=2 Tax=Paenibacillus agaridevorans TaxID=171404 RepID=A0A2R5EKP7_9BACL|nr:hypothetical protein PAT3040_01764 [Paenibacillus agaridevorans]